MATEPLSHREELVPDRQVAKELGCVTLVTIWRWTRRPELGFPRAVKINRRNYRRRSDLEAFKQRVIGHARKHCGGGQ
jgi:hypothetical protein